jgi:excisionase family DNA binding protein
VKEILSIADVAKMLGVNRETVRRWAVSKLIPAFKIHSRGHWQFRAEEVDRLLRSRQPDVEPEQDRSVV